MSESGEISVTCAKCGWRSAYFEWPNQYWKQWLLLFWLSRLYDRHYWVHLKEAWDEARR